MASKFVPVSVAGNTTIHAGRKIGNYKSGQPRYAKLCSGTGSRERHEPGLASGPVTCKRCIAKLPKDNNNQEVTVTKSKNTTKKQPQASRYSDSQIGVGLKARAEGKSNAEVAKAAGVKSPNYFAKLLKAREAEAKRETAKAKRQTRKVKTSKKA